MSFSNFMENYILDNCIFHVTRYVGLCTANPGEGATGGSCNEVPNWRGYTRKQVTSGQWTTSSGGVVYNAAEILFPTASGVWGTVTHFVLTNSGSYGGGNVLLYGALYASRYIAAYSKPRFDPGELSISLD